MDPEQYLEFVSPEEIRVRGSRVGVEIILLEYLRGKTLSLLCERFPTLTRDEISGVIDYYLAHRGEMDACLDRYLESSQRRTEAFLRSGSPAARRMASIEGLAGAREMAKTR